MEKNDHVSLTLSNATITNEDVTRCDRPRKSFRRTWNQLPRCQRNLIILGILAACLMFLFYNNLPGDQILTQNQKQFGGALPFPIESFAKKSGYVAPASNAEHDEINKIVEDSNQKAVLGPPIFKEQNVRSNVIPQAPPPQQESQQQSNAENVINGPETEQNSNKKNIKVLAPENNSIQIQEINLNQNNNNIKDPRIQSDIGHQLPAAVPFENKDPSLPDDKEQGGEAANEIYEPDPPLDINSILEESIADPLAVPGSNQLSIDEYLTRLDTQKLATKQHFHGANNERQVAVVSAFKHSWDGYKKYAWGHDNLKPISMGNHDWFGLGLTLVDALDTMYIMGLDDEFDEARNWVKDVLDFDVSRDVNLFEVTIRVLGGLLSSYHLSGDTLFLRKSIELGNRLLPSFLTNSGIPYSDVNLAARRAHAPKWSPDSSTSEVTTIQLEFRDLSRASNISIYERVSHDVNKKIHALEKSNGLVPIFINANSGTFRSYSTISLGARGDSYYEYLLKQWLQTGRKEHDFLKHDYMRAIDGVLTQLMRRTPREHHVFIGELINGKDFKPKMDHLTCYLPGTLLLGHKFGMPESHLMLAKDLLETCYQTYMRQPTHLAPEITYFAINNNDDDHDIYVKSNDAHNLLRPEFIESLYYFYAITGNSTYQDMGWNIFQAFEKHTKVATGYSSIGNVKNVLNTKMRDMMESFWLGETLKYFYLLFSNNPKEIDLDKWIFNSEAHLVPMHRS